MVTATVREENGEFCVAVAPTPPAARTAKSSSSSSCRKAATCRYYVFTHWPKINIGTL